jgi:molybdate transport repressor ModE-like protein
MKLGAVIYAEQYHYKAGAEESEIYLPMLHLGGTTVIKREMNTLRKGGVSEIAVLAGEQRELLRRHLSHKGAIMVPEETALGAAFVAANWAIETLLEHCDRVIFLPGNLPLLSSDTVKLLFEDAQTEKGAARPNCGSEKGYPILLPENARCPVGAEIEDWLNSLDALSLPVSDSGACMRLVSTEQIDELERISSQQLSENELQCGVRVTIRRNEVFFGPGMYQLLREIERLGSINAACAETGISYSKAWKGINHIEEELGFPILERKNGGRRGGKSELTEEGLVFLNKYGALMSDIERMTQNFFDVYFADFQ